MIQIEEEVENYVYRNGSLQMHNTKWMNKK